MRHSIFPIIIEHSEQLQVDFIMVLLMFKNTYVRTLSAVHLYARRYGITRTR